MRQREISMMLTRERIRRRHEHLRVEWRRRLLLLQAAVHGLEFLEELLLLLDVPIVQACQHRLLQHLVSIVRRFPEDVVEITDDCEADDLHESELLQFLSVPHHLLSVLRDSEFFHTSESLLLVTSNSIQRRFPRSEPRRRKQVARRCQLRVALHFMPWSFLVSLLLLVLFLEIKQILIITLYELKQPLAEEVVLEDVGVLR